MADLVKDSIVPLGRPLFEEKESMDFQFIVDGRPINAHKPVICARSTVLKAMLSSDFLETKNNQMEIPDFEYSVVETAVKFFYYGEFNINETDVLQLVRFIDKYDVVTLKPYLEASMIKNLNTANAVSYYLVADTCNMAKLRLESLRFIKRKIQENTLTKYFEGITQEVLWTAFTLE